VQYLVDGFCPFVPLLLAIVLSLLHRFSDFEFKGHNSRTEKLAKFEIKLVLPLMFFFGPLYCLFFEL